MNNKLDRQTCARLQRRLREAEEQTRQALEDRADNEALRRATTRLLETQREIRELVQQSDDAESTPQDECAVAEAAIAIEREQHELKPQFKDVLKAIFMWQDDPRERASN